jgi:cytochrome P450
MNPPDHTRLRKLVNKGFLPRLIRTLEPRVHERSASGDSYL